MSLIFHPATIEEKINFSLNYNLINIKFRGRTNPGPKRLLFAQSLFYFDIFVDD